MTGFEVLTSTDVSGGAATAWLTVLVAWGFLILVAGWKLDVKGGQPGWVAVIPIVNVLGLLKMARRPMWWILLMLIPVVNIFVVITVLSDLAKAFGRGLGMTLALVFFTPIAYLVLGFGSSEYQYPREPVFG